MQTVKRLALVQSKESHKPEQGILHEIEQVDYSSSAEEELYPQENNSDFDWDQDCFILALTFISVNVS